VIIGNLNKGDYTIASFSLQNLFNQSQANGQRQNSRNMNQTMPRQNNNNVKLEIVYTDTRGNRNTVTKEVAITNTQSATATTTGNGRFQRQSTTAKLTNTLKWIGLIAALFTAALFIRKRYKKGRLKDHEYTYGMAIKDMLPGKKKK
jgi:hypothetical protein